MIWNSYNSLRCCIASENRRIEIWWRTETLSNWWSRGERRCWNLRIVFFNFSRSDVNNKIHGIVFLRSFARGILKYHLFQIISMYYLFNLKRVLIFFFYIAHAWKTHWSNCPKRNESEIWFWFSKFTFKSFNFVILLLGAAYTCKTNKLVWFLYTW